MSEKQIELVPLTSKQEEAGESSPVHAQQPVVYAQQPVVYAQQPVVHTQQPVVYPQQPIVHAQQPIVYTQQPVVYVTQQVVAPRGRAPRPPKDYLVMSIVILLFCFWPIGIAALLKSIEVRGAVARGDYTAARTASKCAYQLNRSAIIIGTFMLVFMAGIFVLIVMMAVFSKQVV